MSIEGDRIHLITGMGVKVRVDGAQADKLGDEGE